MMRELKLTLKFSDHIKNVTLEHFELRHPYLTQQLVKGDFDSYRSYYKDFLIDGPTNYSDLTEHQKYLHDLQGLVSPIISSYRLKTRIPRLRPRTGSITASSRLEDAAQRLASETYHFKERLKLLSRSTSALISDQLHRSAFSGQLGRLISKYERQNERLLRYRNFVVHGPAGRTDEFASLRGWELGGIFHHQDLWFDYNNAFWEAQEEWAGLASALLSSMQLCVAQVQLANESLIADRSLNFLGGPQLTPRT